MSTIQGVHVLYEYEVFGNFKAFTLWLTIILSAIWLIYLVDSAIEANMVCKRLVIIGLVSSFCIVCWYLTLEIPNDTYVKATISKDVPFTELYSNYEIISVEGEIYKLKVLKKGGDNNEDI